MSRNDKPRWYSLELRSTQRSQRLTVTASEIVFVSGGVTCAADLYRPGGRPGTLPCVVMGHGFSGTKGLSRRYAERFATAGFVVLAFDYRHFGASGGQPRQFVDVVRQREDYHAAVHYRSIGQGLFFLTRREIVFLYFPNFMEPLVLIYTFLLFPHKGLETQAYISYRKRVGLIWTFIAFYKVWNEWYLHSANIDLSSRLFGFTGGAQHALPAT